MAGRWKGRGEKESKNTPSSIFLCAPLRACAHTQSAYAYTVLTDHAVRLTSMYAELATRFSAVSAATWMFQHGALTLKELQSIQCLREQPVKAAELLLNIIIEQPSAVYDSFLDALKYSNQQHVYQWIVYDANTTSQICFNCLISSSFLLLNTLRVGL